MPSFEEMFAGQSRVFGLWSVIEVQWGGRDVGLGWWLGDVFEASSMLCQGGSICPGRYLLTNLRFRRVILLETSTGTTYWSNWRTSMTTAVLSYLLGCEPVWFWIHTWWPTARSGSLLICLSIASLLSYVCYWGLPLWPLECRSRWGGVCNSQVGLVLSPWFSAKYTLGWDSFVSG